MAWISINDEFSVFSVREDFFSMFEWIMYFINAYYGYFLIGISLILIFVVFFALAKRIELFSKHFKRDDY